MKSLLWYQCLLFETNVSCLCPDEKRSLRKIWCTPEIELALNTNQKTHKVYRYSIPKKVQLLMTGLRTTEYLSIRSQCKNIFI